MSTDTERLTVSLPDEDYQWVVKQAEVTGNSRAGILRQIVRGVRLGKPKLLDFGESELVFANEAGPTADEETDSEEEGEGNETEESGLESFTTS